MTPHSMTPSREDTANEVKYVGHGTLGLRPELLYVRLLDKTSMNLFRKAK